MLFFVLWLLMFTYALIPHCAAKDYEGGIAQNTGSLFVNETSETLQKGFAILQNWYKAREKFDTATLDKYAKPADPDAERFAQLIWAKTLHIGCGYVKFKSKAQPSAQNQEILVCNYNPAGRVVGQPVYVKGEPCTRCVDLQMCNEETKLCRNEYDELKEQRKDEGASVLGVIGVLSAVVAVSVAVAGVCCMRSTSRSATDGAAPAGGAGDGAAQGGSMEELQKTEAAEGIESQEGIGSQEAVTKSEG